MQSIARIANRQHGVVSGVQLRDLGYDPPAVGRAVTGGRLHRLHQDVFAVGHTALTEKSRWLAAVMAAGPEALLARWSAGRLLGYVAKAEPDGTIEVAVPAGHPRRPDLRSMRLASLEPEHRIVRDGIACTSPSRTICDLASALEFYALERAIERAEFRKELDIPQVVAVAESIDRMRGVRNLRRALGVDRLGAAEAGSELERLALRLFLAAAIDRPELQRRFVIGSPPRQIRVDFYWPEAGLVVEIDGPHHRGRAARRRDAERDAGLRALGLRVLRLDYELIERHPDEAIALVHAALASSCVR